MFHPIDPSEQNQTTNRVPFHKRFKKYIMFTILIILLVTILILLIMQPSSSKEDNKNKPIPPQPSPIKPDDNPPQPSPIKPDDEIPNDINALKLHLLTNSKEAKCLDGTPYGVYYHPGYGEGKNKIVISFWGMNWCHKRNRNDMLSSCASRTNDYYGSSKYFASEYKYEYDFLGGEEAKNKYFYNWNRFDFPYCDGTGIQGQLNEPVDYNGKKLFFRGHANMLAAIKFMFEKIKIEDVDIIVVSGCSSGGFTAFQWTQYISDFVKEKNKNAVVMGIPQGGYFIDYKNIKTNDHDFLLKLKQMYSLVNNEVPAVNKECVKDHPDDPHLCLLPEKLLKYIRAPFLILQAAYDSWHIWDTLGEECHEPGKTLTKCSEEKRKIITEMKNYSKTLLIETGKNKSNLSVWSPACIFHCYGNSYRNSQRYQVRGITIDNIIGEFLESRGEKQTLLFDDVEWPNNTGCNNL